jgi:hypothetical protein
LPLRRATQGSGKRGTFMLSVGRIIDGGFALVRERPRAMLGWAGVQLIGFVAMMLAMRPMFGAQMAALQAQAGGAPGSMPGAGWFLGLIGAELLFLVIVLVLWTAAFRAVLRPAESRFAYMRLGMDELRMLGLSVLLGLMFFVAWIVSFVVITLFVSTVVVGMSDRSSSMLAMMPLIFGLFLLFFVASLFFQVRLSLAFPLTLMRERITIGEAWRLSRGHFWTLFGAGLVITLLLLLVSMAVSMVGSGSYLMAVLRAGGDPQAMALAGQEQMARQASFSISTIVSWVLGIALGTAWIALGAGSLATAARLLLADELDDIEEILS